MPPEPGTQQRVTELRQSDCKGQGLEGSSQLPSPLPWPSQTLSHPLSVPYPFLLPAVGGEVVDGDLDALALLQLLQGGDDEVKVKGVGVVEVEVVAGCLLLLLLGQHLPQSRA